MSRPPKSFRLRPGSALERALSGGDLADKLHAMAERLEVYESLSVNAARVIDELREERDSARANLAEALRIIGKSDRAE